MLSIKKTVERKRLFVRYNGVRSYSFGEKAMEYRIILDCRRMLESIPNEGNKFKTGSMHWALSHALENLEVGDCLVFEDAIYRYGERPTINSLQAMARRAARSLGFAITIFHEEGKLGIYRVS